ncbi:MAG: 50S ribosomal protein L25/general stress protein Ctc [Alphaproteobacteria bacterium]|nr:50S ribosomal protein L25/general stress protein Ctc [Alphaproteobacteria bacterium]MBE8220986.1 50S ribosomal protein L25/general stress protein Ctc [Alphaproteobacteria bacterium]
MANIATLEAEGRERVGKSNARDLRNNGRVPAIIYGDKKDPQEVSLHLGAFDRLYHTGRIMSTLLDLEIDGKKHRVITRDVQLHPVRDTVIHVDFLRLSKDSKIAVEVPVIFSNEEICPGIKTGGVLNVVRYTIELNCPVDSIPESLNIDLSESEMGDSIHISSVALPDGVEPVISDRDFTIATIAAPAALRSVEEEEAEAAAEAEAAEAAEGEEGAEGTEGKEGAEGKESKEGEKKDKSE